MPPTGTESANSGEEKINVSIRGQDDRVLYFKINKTLKLWKIFNVYCEKRQLEVHTIQFLYEGNRITGTRTPNTLRMEDGAEISAFVHQSGGGRQQHGRLIPCWKTF